LHSTRDYVNLAVRFVNYYMLSTKKTQTHTVRKKAVKEKCITIKCHRFSDLSFFYFTLFYYIRKSLYLHSTRLKNVPHFIKFKSDFRSILLLVF